MKTVLHAGLTGRIDMTPSEAVKKVLRHKPVNPVPFSIKFTVEAKEKMVARYGEEFDPVRDTGSYVVASHTNSGWEEVRPGYFKDNFGVVWNKTQDRTLGMVDQTLITEPSLKGFVFPDPDDAPLYRFIEKDKRCYPDHFHMASIGFSLFERAWSLVGMEELMVYLLTEPVFISDLLNQIADYNIRLISNAAALGVDCIHFGDDWGSQHGPLISPEIWRDLIKPPFQRMCRASHEAGLTVSLHCCGNVEALMDDILECGVDVFDPFQPEAMDIWKLREQYRGRLAFWGGLSVQKTMPYGTPEQVRAETRKLLTDMGPGGGYIISPAHSVSGDVPIENIEAFLETVRAQ
jgi:uroporphyrinogen decarboxylase